MSKISFCDFHNLRAISAVFRHAGAVLTSPHRLNDANALLYSAKSFAAAMLAYYLALSIGLERPFWAIVTVYIVSQTSVGASLSKSVYRLFGTVIGAAATVLIVPTFMNMPIVCSLVLTGWIVLCLYFSLLERTPRAYAFVLAGYTASLIGFPAVNHPDAMFDTAIIRVQEIVIGILCAGVIHRYVLPKRLSGLFNNKVAETLGYARKMVVNALANRPHDASGDLHIALALQFLQGVNHHIPYDFAMSVPVRNARKRLHDQLARLLVVSAELSSGRQAINPMPEPLQQLLDEVKNGLVDDDAHARQLTAQVLVARSTALAQQLSDNAQTLQGQLQARFCRHLREAVILLQECERLAEAMAHAKFSSIPTAGIPATGYVFHRDSLSAARTSLGAFAIIFSGCLIWIYSAWPDGGTAVSVIGVCCTLFGSFDTPAPHIIKYIIGSFYGVVISLLYSFAILPQITEFSVLVAALAPAYLLGGSLQARPPTTFMAMGITLTLPILSELGAQYGGDFAAAVNTAIALFAATGFAVVGMSLLQTVQADSAIHRLLRACRRDLRRNMKDETQWTNLMIDRTALLLPRLSRSGQSPEKVSNLMLHSLRVGIATARLRRLLPQLGRQTASDVSELLQQLAYEPESASVRQRVESMIGGYCAATNHPLRRLLCLLLDVHCVLQEPHRRKTDDQ